MPHTLLMPISRPTRGMGGGGHRCRGPRAIISLIEPCVVGMEACATSHHWARKLTALGHAVKLMPPAYVKA
jgi:transposase